MASDVKSSAEPSVTALVSGIINDAQELFKQQVALIRHEVREDFSKTKEALFILAIGIGASVLGGFLVCLMLVHLLEWAFPQLPLWACYAIVGGLFAVPGGILIYLGVKKFQAFNPLPDQSAEALKENMQWITNRR